MAVRTDIDSVKVVIDTALEDSDITAFIGMANTIVTARLGDSDLTDAILKDIETWLTAHLISVSRERFTTQEEIGDAKVTFAGKFGEEMHSTSYGQMVIMLDSTGSFEEKQLKKKPIVIRSIKSMLDD